LFILVAQAKLERLLTIIESRVVVSQWNIATKEARQTREYFEVCNYIFFTQNPKYLLNLKMNIINFSSSSPSIIPVSGILKILQVKKQYIHLKNDLIFVFSQFIDLNLIYTQH
jgi:hypothetical protein